MDHANLVTSREDPSVRVGQVVRPRLHSTGLDPAATGHGPGWGSQSLVNGKFPTWKRGHGEQRWLAGSRMVRQ